MKSTCGISLDYITDPTPCAINCANTARTLVETIDIHNEEFICANATHFGNTSRQTV